MKINILLYLLIMMWTACNGQRQAQEVRSTVGTLQLGTPAFELDKTIWSIFQDSKGNYWFGSKTNGVFFYDGAQLRHLKKADGLVSNEVRAIKEDDRGHIFIESTSGISKFDGRSFTTLKIKNDETEDQAWVLNDSDLWFRIGFDKMGVYRYDGEHLCYLKFPKAPQADAFYQHHSLGNYSPYGVYSIYKDKSGVMWFGTASLGVCRFDGKQLSWHYEEQLQKTPSGGDFGMRSIFEDASGHFWFNNTRHRYTLLPHHTEQLTLKKEKGISVMNESSEEEFPYFLSMKQDDAGDLWMVTYSNGVWRKHDDELIHYPVKDGKLDVLLFTTFKDRDGVLWLGTHNAGVYKYNGSAFEKFQP